MGSEVPRADAAAASVGATDLFVLRRVRGDRFVHLGGSGRGAGWAGLIEVSPEDETLLAQALAARGPVRVARPEQALVFGPYYATGAGCVAVSNDVVVVFGAAAGDLGGVSDDALSSAAALAAEAVRSVTPAKQLADEMEELEAVRALLEVPTADVDEAMAGIASVAATALSCELAAVHLADGDRFAVVEAGWTLRVGRDGLQTALRTAVADGRFPYCVQDAAVVPLPPPLDRETGIRAYYLLELHGLARGVLFVAHTDAAPRGFTLLCRRLGLRLADVASGQLGLALTQEWCGAEAARLHEAFGRLDAP